MKEKKDVKENDRLEELAKNLQGLQTIASICKKLDVNGKTAINYVYEMRKAGYLKTSRGRRKLRMYEISPVRKKELGYPGFYDMINKYSPLKIAKPFEHRIYKQFSIEEVIVRAVKTQDFRTILASIALFNHVNDWSLLYKLAKKENVRRKLGALYDLSRQILRVRRIDKRIEQRLLLGKEGKFIILNIRSNDFPEIEKKWKVHIPFKRNDLMRLKA